MAVARKLGIRLWIMLRDEIDYRKFCRRGQKQESGAACAGMPETRLVNICSIMANHDELCELRGDPGRRVINQTAIVWWATPKKMK